MAKVIIVFTEGATQDLLQAYSWYKEINADLGEDFLSCVDLSITLISDFPSAFSII